MWAREGKPGSPEGAGHKDRVPEPPIPGGHLPMKYLKDLARIRAGHPFRGRIAEDRDGDVHVVQMKDVDPWKGLDWRGLVKTKVSGRKAPDHLMPGDLLFVARGNHHYALALEAVPSPTVASPHFYHVTLHPGVGLLPGFLAWQTRQEPAREYFRRGAEGSAIQSIRRQVLEDLPVAVPPLDRQEAVLAMDRAWRREREVLEALHGNTSRIMAGLARRLLGEDAA